MKRALIWGIVLTLVMAMPQFINQADAKDKWKTYKLIKDGELDTSKWRFNDRQIEGESIVTMSIDGDRVKFEHKPGTDPGSGGGSVWLQLIKNPECVKGIQAEITMGTVSDDMPLDGHFRARIGNTAGAYGPAGDYVWNQLVVRNRLEADGGDRVYGAMDLEDPANGYEWIYDLIYSQFNHPEEVDGSSYLLTLVLDRKKRTVTYSVEGFGTVTYKMPEKLVSGWETFWGIGTRSNDALGSGTVWFSNKVKVLIDEKCKPDSKRPKVTRTVPEDKQRNVSVDLDQTEIKFNEDMQMWHANCGDESCCPEIFEKNEEGDWVSDNGRLCEFEYEPTKNFVFTDDGEGDGLSYNTWYKICVPKDYFFDLAGNGNAKYCYEFKTEKAPEE
jgi:hypothetical protein